MPSFPHNNRFYPMIVAGAVFAFVLLLSVAAALYSRIARLRANPGPVASDYNRLFEELPIPMYIYDYRTFTFLAVTMQPLNNTALAERSSLA